MPPDGGLAGAIRLGGAPVMCVNISSRQLADGDLLGEIAAILEQTGLAPSQLKLEITETAFISDVPGAHRKSSVARRRWGSSGASTISARAIRR